MANPAQAPFQLLGVGRAKFQHLLAEALSLLGTQRTLVVHGSDGLDEVTLSGSTFVTEAAGGRLREFQWTPGDFGLPSIDIKSIQVDGPEQSAEVIRGVLAGRPGPARDIVVANAAASLWVTGAFPSVELCSRRAAEAIDSGGGGRSAGPTCRAKQGQLGPNSRSQRPSHHSAEMLNLVIQSK